jgi:arabinan endo-1,5-alpha-L-arabinosidase
MNSLAPILAPAFRVRRIPRLSFRVSVHMHHEAKARECRAVQTLALVAKQPLFSNREGVSGPWRRRLNYAATLLFACVAALGLVSGCAREQTPAPQQGRAAIEPVAGLNYTNPVYAGDMPDPSVIWYKGLYYAYGTTGSERKADGRIFTLLRSRDLIHWQELGGALMPPSDNPRIQYWAPETTENKGKFYLYYAMGGIEPEKFELRVALSDSPEGPFTDNGQKLMDCESNRFTIDPFPFRDTDGQWYMFYARNFTNTPAGVHPGTALEVDRLLDMTRLGGACHNVVRARFDWTLYQAHRRMDVYGRTFDWHTIEGPCVVKHAGKIYCFYSGSNYQTDRYGVDYVVASNPLGPYADQSDHPRVLHSIPGKVRGPGHHSIVPSPDGRSQFIVYHAWDPHMRVRQMCIDKLVWTEQGPRCKGPTY